MNLSFCVSFAIRAVSGRTTSGIFGASFDLGLGGLTTTPASGDAGAGVGAAGDPAPAGGLYGAIHEEACMTASGAGMFGATATPAAAGDPGAGAVF